MQRIKFSTLENKDFKVLPFTGVWYDSFGCPARDCKWFIYAKSGSGKTSFMIQLAAYMANFYKKVGYVSIEEGISESFKKAVRRADNAEKENYNRIYLYDRATLDELIQEIETRKTVKFWIIDSIDSLQMTPQDIIKITSICKKQGKGLAMVGFSDGKNPKTPAGVFCKYDADIKLIVDRFIIEDCNSRYGGNRQPFVINEQLAAERRGGEKIWSAGCQPAESIN
jgi:hypothetical protein